MPTVYESASKFSPQANVAPDLVVIETSFMKDGKAQAVDGDLALRLFDENSQQILPDMTLSSDPPIYRKASGSGVYYFARVSPEFFRGGIVEARWFARIRGVNFEPSPVVSIVNATATSEKVLLASEIRDWVLHKMGWPKISVELNEVHIAECVDDVLTEFNRWVPKFQYGNLNLSPGQRVYEIPECGRGIIDVQFRRIEGNPLISDPMFGRNYPRWTRIDFDNYILSTSFHETLLRKTGQEPIWRWEPSDPLKLHINTGDGNRSFYKCSYCYMLDCRLEEINPAHHDLFKRMVLARAKMVLGEIREKFGNSVMTPGGNMQLNGEKLKAEGFESYEKLVEDLRGLQIPMWPVWG